jgi:hypothetical protein
LHKLYEKIVLGGSQLKSSISFQEMLKDKIEFPEGSVNSEEKLFHLEYTQKTGVVSYLEWKAHLEPYAIDDPVSMIESSIGLEKNSIRTYLIFCLNVSL